MYVTINDLTQLDELNTNAVKRCLKGRYMEQKFYTWAGPTLVALNPLREISSLYSKEKIEKFAHEPVNSHKPHIFAIGQLSLRHLQMNIGKGHQAIVVNGESGAGKTRSALHLLSYLAAMETNNNEVDHSKNIEVLLCKSNPLLEALGNAATLRNDNSSRFGKLIRLAYTGEGSHTELESAHIETYLLESTRVTWQAEGERNFHIFYQMLSGLPDDVQNELFLSLAPSWAIASTGDCNGNDRMLFQSTLQALEQLELGESAIKNLWQLLAALLHLGNLDFFADGLEWHTTALGHLHAAANLLGIKEEKLWQLLTTRTLSAGSNVVVQPCSTSSECATRRDTLLKLLYRMIFDWVLQNVNRKLKKSHSSKLASRYLCILDLYGFESFEYGNSLEQLCINYANERLQHYFTLNYLKEQHIHLSNEGFNVAELDLNARDKENVLNLMDGPVSVFGVLNEECYLNRGCDESSVCQRIQNALASPTRGSKSVPPSPRTPRTNRAPIIEFTLNHYAGPVTYSTRNMLEKNRDNVPSEFIVNMSKSSSILISSLAQRELAVSHSNTKTGRKHTVLAKFRGSLDNLMKILNSCDVSYVRCIRPTSNSSHLPGQWDDDYVDLQLNACGVCDTIKVSSFGYPIRMSHQEFTDRYQPLLMHYRITSMSEVVQVFRRILHLSHGASQEVRIGKSQVYVTEHGLELMEKRKNEVRHEAATILQRWWKAQLQNRIRAATVLQCWWRTWRREKAATKIQHWWLKKRSIHQMRNQITQLANSIRIIKRVLKRWIYARKLIATIPPPSKIRTVAIVPPLPPRAAQILVPEIPKATVISKELHTTRTLYSGVTLQLPRSMYFFQDGVISIRQPPSAKIRFSTKKTCLPYSHILPKSMMPSGLTDALVLTFH